MIAPNEAILRSTVEKRHAEERAAAVRLLAMHHINGQYGQLTKEQAETLAAAAIQKACVIYDAVRYAEVPNG